MSMQLHSEIFTKMPKLDKIVSPAVKLLCNSKDHKLYFVIEL